ncbi:MAG: hypothetical protein ACLVJ6_13655 [Merdibacter sp.]
MCFGKGSSGMAAGRGDRLSGKDDRRAMVSDKHANFIVNIGAKASEVHQLIEEIQKGR